MILLFNDWVLSKPQGGLLGYQYDNLTRELAVQGDLPEGWTWDILVSAGGNGDTWPLALGNGQAAIALTDDNLSVCGEYYLQLRGTNGDQVRHTNVITAYNSRSLSGAGQWPTLPTEWIQAEKDIKELNAHPPVPGSNGYWLLWDLSSHSYQESDLPVPVGPAGPPNVLEIGTVETLPADQPATASITGESPAQKLNLGIPQGKQGATGNPGAPGKDGQNGITPTLSAGDVETLEPDQPATASVTGEGPAYQINLGIPRGQTGAQGAPGQDGQDGQTPTISVGTVTTLDPGQDATAEITGETPNLVLSLGIPQGQPGKDGVQLNDSAINTTEAWSSKKIVDTLCPAFSVSGNPVTCNPVEGYPLSAVVSLEPKQAGSGDPSPENVRPISGYDSVAVNVRGKNLLSDENFQNSEKNGITFTKMGNGVIHVEGTATSNADSVVVNDVPQLPPGKYVGVSSSNLRLVVKKASTGQNEWYTTGYGVTIEPGDVIQYYYFSVASGLTVNKDDYIFLAPGDSVFSVSDFEPYQPGTTDTLTFPETIYGGTVDAVTGVASEEWAFVELDGSETLEVGSDNLTSVYRYYITSYASEVFYTAAQGVCSHLPVGDSTQLGADREQCIIGYNNKYIYLYLNKTDFPNINSVSAWLAAQASAGTPVQVAYKLATPTSFQATGNQALPAVAGLNTLYTDGDSLAVTGRSDPLSTIQTMQAQITALQDQITQGGTA